ncbi:mannose-1-phosphate guanylyltransferase [Halanaerobium kushneri]|uniref:Mannose-1-phosphate guanylyltransferase n=1 Tax=Halanaerobium kushneri TaxID=56779 RepID=A0A1N7B683_9FIRM|nr:mannose-1-phosphate guanylyltransferase [Halanaerobium kushneri]
MTILPAYHVIINNQEFIENLKKAEEITETESNLVIIGIENSKPETCYGYINYG